MNFTKGTWVTEKLEFHYCTFLAIITFGNPPYITSLFMRNTLFLYFNYCITSFVGVSGLQLSYSVLTEDVIAVCVCVIVYGKWEGRNSCSIAHIVLSSRAEKAHLPSADFTQKILH